MAMSSMLTYGCYCTVSLCGARLHRSRGAGESEVDPGVVDVRLTQSRMSAFDCN